jgi:glyoxylase-like metal-dependent hydrolase (beta-lactamase superfamily II)
MRSGATSRRVLIAGVLVLAGVCASQGQPPGQAAQAGPKLATPNAFPLPGSYPTTESVFLYSDDPGVEVHYTLDGSNPNAASPVFDPNRLLFIAGLYDGTRGLRAGYTIRAMAMKQGSANSNVATFLYTIDRKDRTEYASEETLPGVRMIRDSENDKMFLVRGTQKAVLIDTGMGQGALRQYVAQYAGGLPVEVILTHNHPDHIGQADQFIEGVEYAGEADRPSVAQRLSRTVDAAMVDRNLKIVRDGDRVDIGGRQLLIVAAPGHTNGSILIFDEQNGTLFSGDAFGSNNPTVPDALWMQGGPPMDIYLSSVRVARAKLRGKVKYVLTGHNDVPLAGERYLDNLEAAAQTLIDKGESVLIPSYRPAGLLQVVVGDRLKDPDWAGINVNRARPISAPADKIATLSNIEIGGATLSARFSPDTHDYLADVAQAVEIFITPVTTSTRYKSLTVNRIAAASGSRVSIKLTEPRTDVSILVTSPDGEGSTRYTIVVSRGQGRQQPKIAAYGAAPKDPL